jgi:hypothetical protein
MARGERSEKKPKPKGKDPLEEAISVFARGDYARAAPMLERASHDPELSEGAKSQAQALHAATRVERGALYVGLASLALVIIVITATALTQPG